MLKDMTLGQYFPGNSILHKIDPRMKLILAVLYIVMIFLAKTPLAYVFVLASAAGLIFLSRLHMRVILRGLRPILFIILLTACINIFWTRGETPLVDWKFIHIYPEGIQFAIFMMVRIVSLVIGTAVILTYTTSPIALTDGLEHLLMPLSKLHLPVHEFSMMMTIALRFIPTLVEETDKIMSAQKSRGTDFSSGSLLRRAKALIPVMVPLFLSAINRATELAVAMECRCYRGGTGRTKMNRLQYRPRDFLALLCVCCMCAVVLLLNRYTPMIV